MEGIIINYRSSRHTQKNNEMIIKIDSISDRDKAKALAGKRVVFKTQKGKIEGRIASAHGNKGAVRAIFEKGMPGQAIGQKVEVVA